MPRDCCRLRQGYSYASGTSAPLSYLLDNYDRKLQKRYGGYVQAQYYFTNQWFINYAYGMSKAWGVTQGRDWNVLTGNNPAQYKYLTLNDQTKFWQEHALAVYYKPIQALKFGLQYSYMRTDYFQITTVGARNTNWGDNHRVEFGGWFYF